MRLKTAVLAAALVMLTAGAASAQKLWIGPIVGFTMPMGDFGDVSGGGFHVGITGDYALSGGFSVGGDVLWHHTSGKDDYEKDLSAAAGEPVDVTFTIIPVTVHGKYSFPGETRYRPFVKAGVGIYNVGSKIDAGSLGESSTSDTKLGFNFGGGTTLTQMGSATVGIEGAIHAISTEGSSTNLFTVSATALFGMGSK